MLTYNLHIVDGIYFELINTWEDKDYIVKILDKNFVLCDYRTTYFTNTSLKT